MYVYAHCIPVYLRRSNISITLIVIGMICEGLEGWGYTRHVAEREFGRKEMLWWVNTKFAALLVFINRA